MGDTWLASRYRRHILTTPLKASTPTSYYPLRTTNSLSLLNSGTEQPAKVGTCALDRRALKQLALNVHVKHFDLDLKYNPKNYQINMFEPKLDF